MGRCKSIMLLITYNCNLNCTYCYEPKHLKKRMTSNQAKSYIKDIVLGLGSEYDEFDVQFMGGEPLLEFDLIKEVSEWLWKWDAPLPISNIFIATNGTLLDKEIKDWLQFNKERICCGLSFDGDIPMQNINRTLSASKVDLNFFAKTWPTQTVKMTISPDTIGDLYNGVTYLISQDLKYITADFAMGPKVCWTNEHLTTFYQQLQALSDFYLEHLDLPVVSMLDIDVLNPLRVGSEELPHCGCGERLVCVDTDGEHYACHLFSPISLPVSKAKQAQSINFANKTAFVSDECKECSIKNLCPHCYGMNYYITGDLSKQSTFTCKSTKIQFIMACQFQQQRAERMGDVDTKDNIDKILNTIQL